LKRLLEEINSVQFLEDESSSSSSEGILPLSSPLDLSRATTDSTILDFPRSQSESSLNKDHYEQDLEDQEEEEDNQEGESVEGKDGGNKSPFTEEQRYQKLLRIRDCLGLLRELFFMSKQTLSIESRYHDPPPLLLTLFPPPVGSIYIPEACNQSENYFFFH
jgi:hypothetical protein